MGKLAVTIERGQDQYAAWANEIPGIVKYFKGQGRKVSYDAISNDIGYIEDTFLIHRCDRYDIKGKDTLSGNAKFYMNDLAYKNYLYPGFGYGF